jgi:hypothetical protein
LQLKQFPEKITIYSFTIFYNLTRFKQTSCLLAFLKLMSFLAGAKCKENQIRRKSMPLVLVKIMLTFLFLSLSLPVLAIDRWNALSMIESANRDDAVGRVGEITRYQIRPELWPGGNPLDTRAALLIAQRIMTARIAAFQKTHGHTPNNFEFYVLWNAPAQVDHPHRAVIERAKRFVNLVEDKDTVPATTLTAVNPAQAKPTL